MKRNINDIKILNASLFQCDKLQILKKLNK